VASLGFGADKDPAQMICAPDRGGGGDGVTGDEAGSRGRKELSE
jgi:hypothetical protein